jgi:hypothetical protein
MHDDKRLLKFLKHVFNIKAQARVCQGQMKMQAISGAHQ